MNLQSISPKPEQPAQVPTILPMICKEAGWSHREFLDALSYNRIHHGLFNTISAKLPLGMKVLTNGFPTVEVRRTDTSLSVLLDFGKERIVCGGMGTARLTLTEPMVPESVMAAAIGLPVAKLVGHPLLEERTFIVERVYEPQWTGTTVVVFRMPNCEFKA